MHRLLDLVGIAGCVLPVPFNSGTSFSRLNIKADNRLAAIFTSVRNVIGTPSLSGRGVGYLRVCRLLDAGLLTQAVRPTPSFSSDGASFTLIKDAITMPSIALRAIRALFPPTAVPVSTVSIRIEAYALARLLVSQGRRATVAPAARGFIVPEVQA